MGFAPMWQDSCSATLAAALARIGQWPLAQHDAEEQQDVFEPPVRIASVNTPGAHQVTSDTSKAHALSSRAIPLS